MTALNYHILGRLDVQVAVSDAAMAQVLRPRLEALAWEMMPRVIEQVFDAAVPGEMLELTRLDLDLGRVRADALEEDALAALRVALAEALAAALHRARLGTDDQARLIAAGAARLSRFESFLVSGTLPFPNCDGAFDVAEELRNLASDNPIALVDMLRRNARNRRALERLALQSGADGLTPLLGLLAAANAALIIALLGDIVMLHRRVRGSLLKNMSEAALTQLLWVTTLEFLLRDAGSQFNRRRFLASLIEREAKRLGIAFDALLELLEDALAIAAARAPLRSSLPRTLRELLDERSRRPANPPRTEAADGDDPGADRPLGSAADLEEVAWARAGPVQQGPPDPRSERSRSGLRPFDHLTGKLGEDRLLALLTSTAGEIALRMVDELDVLVSLHGQRALFSIEQSALRREAMALMLAHLALHRSTQFDPTAMWRAVLVGLAQVARLDADALAARLVDRLRSAQGRAGRRLLAAVSAAGNKEDRRTEDDQSIGEGSLADRPHRLVAMLRAGVGGADLIAATGPLWEREFEALLELLAPADSASLSSDFALLVALDRSSRFFDAERGSFVAIAQAAILEALLFPSDRVASRRRVAWRAVITSLAMAAGKRSLHFAAMLRGRLRAAGDSAWREARTVASIVAASGQPEQDDRRAGIAHFLRTGMPAARGADLVAALTNDEAWLADRVRDLAHAMPPAELADRLLDWLMPFEVLALLAPEKAEALLSSVARSQALERDVTRELLVDLLLERSPPPPVAARSESFKRMDRLAALAGWLNEHAPVSGIEATPSDLFSLDTAELTFLLLGEDEEATLGRLIEATAAMTELEAERLLGRIAPWTTQPNLLFARFLRNEGDEGRRSMLLHAAAAALAGAEVDLTALYAPVATTRGLLLSIPTPAERRRGGKAPDVARLLAWLDGGSATIGEAAEMARLFAHFADIADPALTTFLASRRSNPRARARWAAILPVPALTRLVYLLVPTEARALVDGIMLLTTAWRQVAPFGARRPAPQDLWRALLDRIVAPTRVAVPRVIDALIAELAGDDAGGSAKLRACAGKLARDGGYASVAAALRRTSEPARPATRSARPDPKPVDAPEEPKHALYVGNAGLVLLNPFLPTLFERLGLLASDPEGRPFVPRDETASRAVHLLQYLVDGRLDRTEPELVLNKLLCGMPSFVAVARSIEPVQADLDMCDDLLRAVIANWPILADMTPDALRETFLQREGRLRHADEKWLLLVQRKTLDVLTDQLPWSFALVYHRWMVDPIHVTW